jgi:Tol biopolymer transport system component
MRKALELASQAADGLAAAHEQDIVHRDLKPANLFVTRDGRVKILDFGLAKLQTEEPQDDNTRPVGPATEPGAVMGTVGYMSPEQVRAERVDARSDLFSLGVVLYEMLSGQAAFKRKSAAETMSAILHEDPRETSQLEPAIPASVDRIVRRCLEKHRAERFQSARDLAFALSNAMEGSGRDWSGAAAAQPAPGARLRAGRIPATIAAVILAAGAGAFVHSRFAAPGMPAPVRVQTLTFSGQDWAPSVAPDGKMIAFTSQRDGRPRIWLRQMTGGAEVPLTEGPDHAPQFSPDGTSILFIRDEVEHRSAYRVPVLGGSPRKIFARVAEATWSPDATRIAYARYEGEAGNHVVLGIADVQSGQTTDLAELKDRNAYGLTWSPTGRWIAAASTGIILNAAVNHLLLVDPESGEVVETVQTTQRVSAPTWTNSGTALLYAQSTSSLGDISSTVGRVLRHELGSKKQRTLFWIESVYQGGGDFVRLDVAGSGRIVFDELVTRQNLVEVRLADARFPRGLLGEPRALTRGHCRDRQPAYSHDGTYVVFSSNRSGNLDLWILNTVSGDTRQLTDDESEDWDPAFTPDGQSVLWSSNRGGHLEIWMAAIDGSGAHQITQDGLDAENPTQTLRSRKSRPTASTCST